MPFISAKSEEAKKMIEVVARMIFPSVLYVLLTGTPEERVQILRQAFMGYS